MKELLRLSRPPEKRRPADFWEVTFTCHFKFISIPVNLVSIGLGGGGGDGGSP